MHCLVFLASGFTSVVQVTGVRMYHDQALYKEPHGGKELSSQQDQKIADEFGCLPQCLCRVQLALQGTLRGIVTSTTGRLTQTTQSPLGFRCSLSPWRWVASNLQQGRTGVW